MSSKDEVSSKILTYQSQLAQVKEFLQSDPNNQQFIQLQHDLNQAIALTTNLLQAQASDDDNDHDEDEDEDENPFIKAILPSKSGAISIGENIEVSSGDRTYAGTVIAINSDDDTCTVKYFEYADTEVVLPLDSVNRIAAGVYTPNDVHVGMKIMCKYAQDQKLYQAEITEITTYGMKVSYTEYGNTEVVPIEYLRPIAEKKADKKSSDNNTSGLGVVNEKGLIPIPDKLKILATDTEEEKLRKKKKLKAIKNHNRKVSIEVEMQETQQSWKKFVTKGTKRSMAGIVKSSIFATSEDVDGRVGIVNSGKGLTEYTQRKKHHFQKQLP